MPISDASKIGQGNRFEVTATPGKWDLGSWAKAEGLDVTWDMPDYRAGDQGNMRYFAPANTKYSPVKLTRAATAADSPSVQKYLAENSFKHDVGGTVTITLKDSFGAAVLSWTLQDALPKKWAVTSFDAGSSTVAIETLEWEHSGFLENEGGG